MPEIGLPKGLSMMLGQLLDNSSLKGWHVYHYKRTYLSKCVLGLRSTILVIQQILRIRATKVTLMLRSREIKEF